MTDYTVCIAKQSQRNRGKEQREKLKGKIVSRWFVLLATNVALFPLDLC